MKYDTIYFLVSFAVLCLLFLPLVIMFFRDPGEK